MKATDSIARNPSDRHHLTRRQALRSTATAAAVIALPAGGAMALPEISAALAPSPAQAAAAAFWPVWRSWEAFDGDDDPDPTAAITAYFERTDAIMADLAAAPIGSLADAVAVLDVVLERTGWRPAEIVPGEFNNVREGAECLVAVRDYLAARAGS